MRSPIRSQPHRRISRLIYDGATMTRRLANQIGLLLLILFLCTFFLSARTRFGGDAWYAILRTSQTPGAVFPRRDTVSVELHAVGGRLRFYLVSRYGSALNGACGWTV